MNILLQKCYNEIVNKGAHVLLELKRWYNFWESKLNNVNGEITRNIKNKEKS